MVMGPSGNGHARKTKGKRTKIYYTNTLSASFTDLPFSMCYFPASAASKAQTLQEQPLLQTKMEQGYPNVVLRQNSSAPGSVMWMTPIARTEQGQFWPHQCLWSVALSFPLAPVPQHQVHALAWAGRWVSLKGKRTLSYRGDEEGIMQKAKWNYLSQKFSLVSVLSQIMVH